MTEIKGGSDLGANVETVARPAGDRWLLTATSISPATPARTWRWWPRGPKARRKASAAWLCSCCQSAAKMAN